MNTAFTQKNRKIAVENNPLGKDVLLLTAFTGKEELSEPFNFQLEMLSEKGDIASRDIVGRKITFRISQGDEKTRYFNGYVSRFIASSMTAQGMRLYRAEVVPWLWFLTRTTDCRIFQNQTVPQIIEQVFADHGEIKDYEITEVKGTHPKREYCVQYRETDFNFVSRLMEEEGIFYWFRHEEERHTLILADHKGAYKDLPDKEVEYASGASETLAQAQLHSWEHRHEFRPGKWVQTDYNFKTPSTKLHTSTQTIVDLPDMKKYEIFDFPGRYGVREDGDQLTKLRMEETEACCDQVIASGTYCSFTPGGKFTLKRHECTSEEGQSYLVTSVQHSAEDQTYFGSGSSSQRYSNVLTCIPADVVFRPASKTQKPFVHGPQTAVVVGPGGEEIHTDEFGRVKVQFHWDRYGKMDENSSCFIRVSHPWAGKGWGSVSIPRIGQEVIVDFIEGDPDQPIITGRVYNAETMPPYGLPAGGVVSGIKSNTHKGKGYNEMSMDDTAGKEKITIHGQYDMATTVEHDQTTTVHNNRTDKIDVDDSETVGSNQTISIGSNQKITITANRTESVGGTENITITGHRTETVNGGETVTVNGGRTHTVNGVQTTTISLAEVHSVGAGRMHNVGAAEAITVGGAQMVNVGGAQMVSVGGVQRVNVGALQSIGVAGPHKLSAASISETSKGIVKIKAAATTTVEAPTIILKAGGSKIIMDSSGVTIKAAKITLKSSGSGSFTASGSIKIKGSNLGED